MSRKHHEAQVAQERQLVTDASSVLQRLEEAERHFVSSIEDLHKQAAASTHKTQKYDKKYSEVIGELNELTRNYLAIADDPIDYKVLLDAELKYKLSFYQFSDIRVKRMDKLVTGEKTRQSIIDLDRELRRQLDEMCTELDRIGEASQE